MGLLSKLFGSKEPEYPALDPASPAAACIEKFRGQIEALTAKIKDRYEAVPASDALYIFLGQPPGMFGITWFLEGDDEEHNLKKLMAKKGLSQRKMDLLVDKLRAAYVERQSDPRYATSIDGRTVVVTPSDAFAARLYSILHVMDE